MEQLLFGAAPEEEQFVVTGTHILPFEEEVWSSFCFSLFRDPGEKQFVVNLPFEEEVLGNWCQLVLVLPLSFVCYAQRKGCIISARTSHINMEVSVLCFCTLFFFIIVF